MTMSKHKSGRRIRAFALLLLILCLLFTLPGCSGSTGDSSQETESSLPAETVSSDLSDSNEPDAEGNSTEEESAEPTEQPEEAEPEETESEDAEADRTESDPPVTSDSEDEQTSDGTFSSSGTSSSSGASSIQLADIPDYSGSPYVVINNNVPFFTDSEMTTTSYESYSSLDSLGRCGVAMACIGQDIMPTETRGNIGSVKPTGWHTVKYDIVSGKYLYNRCHLIAYELAGENANEKNLITGTRYFNVDGMLPFENQVADYVKETDNHVLYRVTPMFEGNNLVADGVLMEAMSMEDRGDDILFNVFCYNVQPGITIDYATGDSWEDGTYSSSGSSSSSSSGSTGSSSGSTSSGSGTDSTQAQDATPSASSSSSDTETTYILNTNTKKFHYPSCSSASQISDANKQTYTGSREDLISQGYEPCKKCNP